MAKFRELAVRYRDDADFRTAIDGGDVDDAVEYLGIEVPEGMAPKLHFDNAEVRHVMFPPDPNAMIHDEALMAVAGGKSAGQSGCTNTASTFACSSVPSTVGSASTTS